MISGIRNTSPEKAFADTSKLPLNSGSPTAMAYLDAGTMTPSKFKLPKFFSR